MIRRPFADTALTSQFQMNLRAIDVACFKSKVAYWSFLYMEYPDRLDNWLFYSESYLFRTPET